MRGVDHLDAMAAQEGFVAAEIDGVVDDEARDLELHDRARTHHAGRQRRVERRVAIGELPPRLAQAIHLAMRDRVAVLDALVVTGGDQLFAARERRADGQAALFERAACFVEGEGDEGEVGRGERHLVRLRP